VVIVLGPDDVGHRVVVRRHAGHRDDRTLFSDVLGELTAVTATEMTIRTRRQLVRVPVAEVTHAKRVPRRRRVSATESLERLAAAGWPAPDREYLGDWLLRAAGGWTARGNSALPIGDPGRPLGAAVDAVREWYQTRNLPPRITVADPVGGRLTAELRGRAWTPSPPTLVQTADLTETGEHAETAGPLAATAGQDNRVRLATVPSAGWLAAVAGYRGALPAAAHAILTGVPAARFASVDHDGRTVAVGRGVIADDDRRWLGIALVTVDPVYRRRGLGRAIVAGLTRWAVDAGATRAYLQVEERNTVAVAMYAALGFTTHHAYVTWTAPKPAQR
jgi:GNAT superfamily N-acetyltransferase